MGAIGRMRAAQLAADSRGVSSTEYLTLAAFGALAVATAFAAFGDAAGDGLFASTDSPAAPLGDDDRSGRHEHVGSNSGALDEADGSPRPGGGGPGGPSDGWAVPLAGTDAPAGEPRPMGLRGAHRKQAQPHRTPSAPTTRVGDSERADRSGDAEPTGRVGDSERTDRPVRPSPTPNADARLPDVDDVAAGLTGETRTLYTDGYDAEPRRDWVADDVGRILEAPRWSHRDEKGGIFVGEGREGRLVRIDTSPDGSVTSVVVLHPYELSALVSELGDSEERALAQADKEQMEAEAEAELRQTESWLAWVPVIGVPYAIRDAFGDGGAGGWAKAGLVTATSFAPRLITKPLGWVGGHIVRGTRSGFRWARDSWRLSRYRRQMVGWLGAHAGRLGPAIGRAGARIGDAAHLARMAVGHPGWAIRTLGRTEAWKWLRSNMVPGMPMLNAATAALVFEDAQNAWVAKGMLGVTRVLATEGAANVLGNGALKGLSRPVHWVASGARRLKQVSRRGMNWVRERWPTRGVRVSANALNSPVPIPKHAKVAAEGNLDGLYAYKEYKWRDGGYRYEAVHKTMERTGDESWDVKRIGTVNGAEVRETFEPTAEVWLWRGTSATDSAGIRHTLPRGFAWFEAENVRVWRGDSRPPHVILREGFEAKGSHRDLEAHLLDQSGGYVSTSRSADVAEKFGVGSHRGIGWVYEMRAPRGIDVDRGLAARPGDGRLEQHLPNEQEIAVPGRVDPEHIVGARRVTGTPSRIEHRSPVYSHKVVKQMDQRGWDYDTLEQTVRDPTETRSVRDTRHLPGGERMDEPATAYIGEDGSYVVVNDRTEEIVQMSDRTDPDPKTPW